MSAGPPRRKPRLTLSALRSRQGKRIRLAVVVGIKQVLAIGLALAVVPRVLGPRVRMDKVADKVEKDQIARGHPVQPNPLPLLLKAEKGRPGENDSFQCPSRPRDGGVQ